MEVRLCEELVTGSDGQHRGAFVEVMSGTCSRSMSLHKYGVQHLYPLAVQCVTSPQEKKTQNPLAHDEQQPAHIDTMPSPQSKRVEQLKINDCIKELNS